jgi:hypothetical protein
MRNGHSSDALYGVATAVGPKPSSVFSLNAGETGPMVHFDTFPEQPDRLRRSSHLFFPAPLVSQL